MRTCGVGLRTALQKTFPAPARGPSPPHNSRTRDVLVRGRREVSSSVLGTAVQAEAATWRWVDSCVVGMGKRASTARPPLSRAAARPCPVTLPLLRAGLCPFAAPVRNLRAEAGQPALRCAVTSAASESELLDAVRGELAILAPGIKGDRAEGAVVAPQSTLLVVAPEDDVEFLSDYRQFVSVMAPGFSAFQTRAGILCGKPVL